MNNDSFLRHVEKTCGCDPAALELAVQRGISRAKADRLDARKLFRLAAACAATVILSVTVNTPALKPAVNGYLPKRSQQMPDSAEAVDRYASALADILIKYLGDD